MNNYKLTISYDGTKYSGWQRLAGNDNTIQGKIESVLSLMLGHRIEIHGAGRTDAGVHAIAQTANFQARTNMSTTDIKNYINKYLPEDIAVLSVNIVHNRFHSRLNALSKTYRYVISTGKPDVFKRKYILQYDKFPDIEKMRAASAFFTGTHDFKAFCSNKRMKKSTVRTIYSINIEQNKEEIIFTYNGNGFLYNMIRIITGTLVEIGCGDKHINCIQDIFQSGLRENAGKTLPAKGLTLVSVYYGETT